MNLVTNASEAIGDRDGVIRVITGRLAVGSDSSERGGKELAGRRIRAAGGLRHRMRDDAGDATQGFRSVLSRRSSSVAAWGSRWCSASFAGLEAYPCRELARQRFQRPSRAAVCRGDGPAHDAPVAARPQAREWQTLGGTSILVVEDEPTLLLAVSRLLQSAEGFSVIQASDGSSALELIRARQDHLDAMLLDVTLPGASAREVLEEAERLRPDLAVILTSAYSHETILGNFDGLRAEHFLRKPFRADDFANLLLTLLERSPAVRASRPETGKADGRWA